MRFMWMRCDTSATAKQAGEERSGGRGGPCAGCDGGANAVAHEREIAHGVVAAREMHVESARASCLSLRSRDVGLFTRPRSLVLPPLFVSYVFFLKIFENWGDPQTPLVSA